MITTKNPSPKTVITTGAAGFIGSQVVRQLLRENYQVIAFDALTYSGRSENLSEVKNSGQYLFVEGSINDAASINAVLRREEPIAVLNLAAETHVDRSIDGPGQFLVSNVAGTQVLLQVCLEYWRQLPPDQQDAFRFVQISTDEVYGSIDLGAAPETAG
ncbi:MAG: GDP-mannose 4,6-dehydratase, partial [Rhodospirillales bacterium]|nr:GDP-mannose 4,6-dehydratase [Rhodospirillales bacterium]